LVWQIGVCTGADFEDQLPPGVVKEHLVTDASASRFIRTIPQRRSEVTEPGSGKEYPSPAEWPPAAGPRAAEENSSIPQKAFTYAMFWV
jgi:hypothetical protein